MAEVKEILSYAQKLELDIIPLVQTFGHLEWILKVAKFRKYRQNDMYPQVIYLHNCLLYSLPIAFSKEYLNLRGYGNINQGYKSK